MKKENLKILIVFITGILGIITPILVLSEEFAYSDSLFEFLLPIQKLVDKIITYSHDLPFVCPPFISTPLVLLLAGFSPFFGLWVASKIKNKDKKIILAILLNVLGLLLSGFVILVIIVSFYEL